MSGRGGPKSGARPIVSVGRKDGFLERLAANYGRAGGGRKVRDTVGYQIVHNRYVVGCTESGYQGKNFVLFDQLLDRRNTAGRAVTVILVDEFDLAAVNPALVVD